MRAWIFDFTNGNGETARVVIDRLRLQPSAGVEQATSEALNAILTAKGPAWTTKMDWTTTTVA